MPQVYVSLGSNIRAEANICSCTQYLRARFKRVVSSDVYQTPAEGFEGAAFLNSVVGFETNLSITELRDYLRNLEDLHGRERGGEKFSSRTLDVDLLLYGKVVLQPEGNLPHSDILNYSFVLIPLAEIAPEQTHPVLNKNFHQLAHNADFNRTKMVPVEINCES
uniref:2-amino-4-hydroxy-6-hydroxymethyldihydropteridine pyrophosphokinase n=1 Tax=uncultured Thiotrichaceae bacterium TaxID=298394 RepID=A0A6S6UJQ5_9GAMM|nr:MAG: 2-amino-4-hydroxy-6-hydroxymethyldihydropteridinepyrophosphokinase (EC [uncultured Thiotrichaceae bacterium]